MSGLLGKQDFLGLFLRESYDFFPVQIPLIYDIYYVNIWSVSLSVWLKKAKIGILNECFLARFLYFQTY